MKAKLFKRFALTLFILFILNSVASYLYWYQSWVWFDNVPHFLGGITGGIFLMWFFYDRYCRWKKEGKIWRIVLVHGAVFLAVAILWEVMEFSLQDIFNIGHVLASMNDSILDVIFGVLGSFTALTYYFSRLKKEDVEL